MDLVHQFDEGKEDLSVDRKLARYVFDEVEFPPGTAGLYTQANIALERISPGKISTPAVSSAP